QGQRKFALVTNAQAVHVNGNSERTILVAEGLELRLIENLLKRGTYQFIPLTGFRFEMAPPFGFPVLFLGSLELPSFFGIPNELGSVQPLDRSLNLAQRSCLTHFIDQYSGEIGLGAG